MLKGLLLIAAAAVGGIYLTSQESGNLRKSINEKKEVFSPIINDLKSNASKVLDGSQQIDSEEIRANIDMLVSEARKTIMEIDFEQALETIKEAIQVASKKIREAMNELDTEVVAEKIESENNKVEEIA